jgi:predicted DNA-binding antitoxin AbrB/MazE fold protein
MIETVDAIYENGIFRPLDEIHISEGLKVKLIIDSDNEKSKDIINLATGVYDGLSEKDISEIEKIALDRRDFFDRENGNE